MIKLFTRSLLAIMMLITYIFLYAPIIVLVVYSFNTSGFPSSWTGFTWHWYYELFFNSEETWRAFGVSLLVASSSSFLSMLMGCFLIFFRSVGGSIGKTLPLFYINLVFPETVLAISLMSYFLLLKIPLGINTLIITHTILGMGFMIPVLYMRFLQIDSRLNEASLALGASATQTFFRIILPLLKPSMIACGLLIFILSFDDFIFSFFCAGPHIQTISLHLLSMIRTGISPTMNALTSILLIFSGALAVFFFSPKIRSRIF